MKQLLCLIEETDAPQQANIFAWRSAKDWSSGTKSTSGPRGYEGKQIEPLTKIKIAFLLPKYFPWQWKLWKRRQRKKWAVINDAIIVDALVSVTVNGQQRLALSISSRVQKCMLADMSGDRECWEQIQGFEQCGAFWRLMLILTFLK